MSSMSGRAVISAMIIASLSIGSCAVPVFAATPAELVVQVVSRPSASVPIGAQRVTMLTVRFTASCARDVHVAAMTVHHKALGDFHDVERVYAMADTKRQTRTAPMTGSEGTVALRWFRGLTVKACETVSMDIVADFSASAAAAGEHAFAIDSRDDVNADAPVRIVVNPAGAPSVTIPVGAVSGTVTFEYLPLPGTLTYGAARTVSRLRLRADSRDDQAVSAITFINDGTARDTDLQNLLLETSGHTILSKTYPYLESDRIRVVLDPPLILKKNEIRQIQLLADIRASRRKTVRFIIQEPSDVEASPVIGR